MTSGVTVEVVSGFRRYCEHCLLLQVLVFKTDTMTLVASFRVTTGNFNTTAIKSIEFARRGE